MPKVDILKRVGASGGSSAASASPRMTLNTGDTAIVLSEDQHSDLLHYLLRRLDANDYIRQQCIDNYRVIDKEVNGFLQRDAEDEERMRDNIAGSGTRPVDEKLPLTFAQLDECLTYMAQVLAPDEGIYGAIAPKDYQHVAKGFTRLMNMHAERFGHYLALMRMIFDGLKYNAGGLTITWRNVVGNRVIRGPGGPTIQRDTVLSGNELVAADMYNLIWDGSVPLERIASDGEFFAQFDVIPPFRVRKMEADGKIEDADAILETQPSRKYYEIRPLIGDSTTNNNMTDWFQVFTMGQPTPDGQKYDMGAVERGVVHCWVNPKKMGLSDDDELQVWRFVMINSQQVIQATHLGNAHGELPFAGCRPLDDGFGFQTRSYAQLLTPLNRFGSFVMNSHQQATRKELVGGLTVYNEQMIPELGDENVKTYGGKVAARGLGSDVDIRRHIAQFNDAPDTSNTANNIELVTTLMQLILPTNAAQQVANLDRATQYQAAATVQSSNRRNLRIAKTISTQAMDPVRRQQYYNILQWQEQIDVIDPDTGDLRRIDPTEFTDAHLEFQLADGLRGIDTYALILHTKETLNALLQSPRAGDVDIVGLLNYISSLWGDDTDWAQFKIDSPIDGLAPQDKQLAFQLLQQYVAERQGNPGQAVPGAEGNPEAG